MSANPSDQQLINRLQSGNLDALGLLYERHKLCVYRTALAVTNDPSAAEDILQDCFLRLHRYAHSVDSSLPLAPWLYRVTVNLSYNREKRKKIWTFSLDEVMHRLVSPVRRSPEWQAELSDTQRTVIKAIASLDAGQRVVIVLFYLNSLRMKEIASILDLPIGTVKSRLYYGRENLRRKLEEKQTPVLNPAYEYT